MQKKRFMKRFLTYLLFCTFLILPSCQRTYTEDEISILIQKNLQEKYHLDFIVDSVKETTPSRWLETSYYIAECEDISGTGPFAVMIGKDGKEQKDNYEGYLYKDNIDQDLLEILSQVNGIDWSRTETTYELTNEKYGSFREYVRAGNAVLQTDILVYDDTDAEAADTIFLLVDSLQKKGYGYNLEFSWNGKSYVFIRNGHDEALTKEDINIRINRSGLIF